MSYIMNYKYILFLLIGVLIFFILNQTNGFSVGIMAQMDDMCINEDEDTFNDFLPTDLVEDLDDLICDNGLICESNICVADPLVGVVDPVVDPLFLLKIKKKYDIQTNFIYIKNQDDHWVMVKIINVVKNHDIIDEDKIVVVEKYYTYDFGPTLNSEQNKLIESILQKIVDLTTIGITWLPLNFHRLDPFNVNIDMDNVYSTQGLIDMRSLINLEFTNIFTEKYPSQETQYNIGEEKVDDRVKNIQIWTDRTFYISQKYNNKNLNKLIDDVNEPSYNNWTTTNKIFMVGTYIDSYELDNFLLSEGALFQYNRYKPGAVSRIFKIVDGEMHVETNPDLLNYIMPVIIYTINKINTDIWIIKTPIEKDWIDVMSPPGQMEQTVVRRYLDHTNMGLGDYIYIDPEDGSNKNEDGSYINDVINKWIWVKHKDKGDDYIHSKIIRIIDRATKEIEVEIIDINYKELMGETMKILLTEENYKVTWHVHK